MHRAPVLPWCGNCHCQMRWVSVIFQQSYWRNNVLLIPWLLSSLLRLSRNMCSALPCSDHWPQGGCVASPGGPEAEYQLIWERWERPRAASAQLCLEGGPRVGVGRLSWQERVW